MSRVPLSDAKDTSDTSSSALCLACGTVCLQHSDQAYLGVRIELRLNGGFEAIMKGKGSMELTHISRK